jgi:hypothetical protein
MLYILEMIYSFPFMWGAATGAVLWKIYCYAKARVQHHAVARMSRVWISGLCAVGALGYVLLATARTEQRTVELNTAVTRCWSETYQQTKAQIDINAQNDGISRQQQALQRQYDEATSDWLKDLVAPPGLSDQPTNSPARQDYGLRRTAAYQDQLNELGKQFDALVAQRKALDEQRAQHPLPEERCGRS